ncbi:SNF2-related protein [Kitasatospora sp. NBC_00240]|uniref:SNF2-related protein n=1 Tax=Kitasatospora sp. NBC_00240 TaxID=2903567 RepID=UPI00224E62F9|nr:SNF2-related protein [Kitasatospora sp. NBC_00240]MCX5215709.1 SNF2-related protein [Kitasatospora sp. NBC_00240]
MEFFLVVQQPARQPVLPTQPPNQADAPRQPRSTALSGRHDGHLIAPRPPLDRAGQDLDLGGLGSEEFYTFLKAACLSAEPGPEPAEAASRADTDRLGVRDLRLLLFLTGDTPHWRRARQAALDQAVRTPPLVPGIVAAHAQVEMWPPPAVQEAVAGSGKQQAFLAQATLGLPGEETSGAVHRAATPREARQRALLSLLAELADLPDPGRASAVAPSGQFTAAGRTKDAPAPRMGAEAFQALLQSRVAAPEPDAALEREILRRCEREQLKKGDIHRILLTTGSPGWAEVREAVMRLVARQPGTAAAVLAHAGDPDAGPWLRYDEGVREESGGSVLVCTAELQAPDAGTVRGAEQSARSKKDGRHRAACSLLAHLAGTRAPQFPPVDPSPTIGAPGVPQLRDGKNPLSILNEYAQVGGITKPVYTVTVEPLPGRAIGTEFVCTVTCDLNGNPLTATGRASSKPDARTRAAQSMVDLLRRTTATPDPAAPATSPTPGTRPPAPAATPATEQPPAPPSPEQSRPAAPAQRALPHFTPPAPDRHPADWITRAAAEARLRQQLATGTALLYLPSADASGHLLAYRPDGEPLPDADLPAPLANSSAELALGTDVGVRRAHVHGWAVPVATAVPLLLDLDQTSPAVHPSTLAWARVARLGLQIVAARLVYPSVSTAGHDRWRAGPMTPRLAQALDDLAAAMPPHAHCLLSGHTPLRITGARPLVSAFLDDLANSYLKTPGAAALVGDLPYASTTPRDAGHLHAWADSIEQRLDPFPEPHLVLHIKAPSTDHGTPTLRASLALRIATDTEEKDIPAANAWADPATAGLDPGATARVQRVLRRAARICPSLAPLARQEQPVGLDLTGPQAVQLLGPATQELERAGITIHWPAQLVSALATHTVVGRSTTADRQLGLTELLDFRWRIALDGSPLTEAEMDTLAEAARPLVRLREQWVLVDPQTALRAGDRTLKDLSGVEALTAALTGTITVDGEEFVCEAGAGLTSVISALRTGDTSTDPIPVPSVLNATLRDYQHRALTWLARTTSLGFGACLADDMGLGKTLTAIAFILHRHTAGSTGPTLVVCPSSLVTAWAREIARFAPGIPVVVYHGAGRTLTHLPDDAIVITTYGILRSSPAALLDQPWSAVLADEAQNVKNHRSAAARRLRELTTRTRVAITGTPIENNLTELWAILDWANPGLLGTLTAFRERYARAAERDTASQEAQRLARLISPFMLRRLKSDPGIAPELPAKVHSPRIVQLTTEQAALYEAVVREAMAGIAGTSGINRRGLVLKLLQSVKQICNSPAHYLKDTPESVRADPGSLAARSAKVEALDELLAAITDSGEAVLVFTSYVTMGHLLQAYLEARGVPVQFLHGKTTRRRRQEIVDTFQAGRTPVLILSVKAAGTGLTLTRATHVIHYDRPWNPAVEDQATDRAHRIGQHLTVQVHALVTEGTVEDRITALLEHKRALNEAVLAGGEQALTELDDRDLSDLVSLGSSR